tara:strand:+ start:31 stop:417 length:387 start_codon:yes stop_codon:yes gene_type:complete
MTITIDGTTGIASVDGSAGSPSVRGSDANSGIVYSADNVAFSTGGTSRFAINSSGHVLPSANNTYDLGSASYAWKDIYTNDLNLSNKGHANDVDGTWGSYTIQEGENDLFLLNKRNGKKYKFNLTEVS